MRADGRADMIPGSHGINAAPPAILVVEDETAVRLMICRMIRGLGFDCV